MFDDLRTFGNLILIKKQEVLTVAFVNERLDEKDIKLFESLNLKNPWGAGSAIIPREMSVDRDNNYYLFCLGGQGHTLNQEYPPYYYALLVDNTVINITARYQRKGKVTDGFKFTWYFEGIYIPKELNDQDKIISIIKDAFTVDANSLCGGYAQKIDIGNIKAAI